MHLIYVLLWIWNQKLEDYSAFWGVANFWKRDLHDFLKMCCFITIYKNISIFLQFLFVCLLMGINFVAFKGSLFTICTRCSHKTHSISAHNWATYLKIKNFFHCLKCLCYKTLLYLVIILFCLFYFLLWDFFPPTIKLCI